MPPPPVCPCCQGCVPCRCVPKPCMDLIVFGGSCPPCLPLATRIPVGVAGSPPEYPCVSRWLSYCTSRPPGMQSACTSFGVPQACPYPSVFPDCTPPTSPVVLGDSYSGYIRITVSCSPTAVFGTYYRVFVEWYITGPVPPLNVAGWLQADCDTLDDIQCDPFRVTFRTFTKSGGLYDPCPTVPTSMILVDHV